MAKIYTVPTEVGPSPHYGDGKNYAEREQAWLEKLRLHVVASAKAAGTFDPHVGETIKFQVADNYARYIVASIKPLALIHIPIGDGYTFQYANRLTVADVRAEVEKTRKWAALFNRKS